MTLACSCRVDKITKNIPPKAYERKKLTFKSVAFEFLKLSLHFIDNYVFKEVFFNSKMISKDY